MKAHITHLLFKQFSTQKYLHDIRQACHQLNPESTAIAIRGLTIKFANSSW